MALGIFCFFNNIEQQLLTTSNKSFKIAYNIDFQKEIYLEGF